MRRHDSVAATDQEALATLLAIHAVPDARILDVTHNKGRIWKSLPHQVHRADIDPGLHADGFTDTVADFRALPFPAASWDVLVFDPPHITDAGDGIAGAQQWGERYGTRGDELRAESVGHLFVPFLREARRVLIPGTGIVLAKIADMIHSGRYQWQHVDLIQAARTEGFTACDGMIRLAYSRGGLVDPRWRRIYHVRGVHTYWLVLRSGSSCMAVHAPAVEREETAPLFAEVEVA